MHIRTVLLACIAATLPSALSAQSAPPPDDEANPPSSLYQLVGVITPRSSTDLATAQIQSPFSIGAEQTDRGYSTFSKWSTYLPWLGVPAARVQTGWANVEATAGTYDFTRLDEIYNGMSAVSVKPWFDLVYGNPVYSGGGSAASGSALPSTSTSARTAWLAFVTATVTHFSTGGRAVIEWEIWNEPDHAGITGADYATFAVQTAQAIKAVEPNAGILLSFTGADATFYNTALDNFDAQKGSTIPSSDVQVIFHPYSSNPDSNYGTAYASLRSAVVAKGYRLRQGESGAPSVLQTMAALANLPWTETRQAKYDVRRMLDDFFRGLPSNIFTITDTHMPGFVNAKGTLLTVGDASKTGPTYGDQTVSRPKVVYGTIRAVTAIFDNRVVPVTDAGCTASGSGYTVQAYTRLDPQNIRRNALAVWRTTPPAGSDANGTGINNAPADITVTCTNFEFPRFKSNSGLRPRYTDLLSSKVYALLSAATVVHSGTGVTVTGLRVYDSPVIMADQGIVPITTP